MKSIVEITDKIHGNLIKKIEKDIEAAIKNEKNSILVISDFITDDIVDEITEAGYKISQHEANHMLISW